MSLLINIRVLLPQHSAWGHFRNLAVGRTTLSPDGQGGFFGEWPKGLSSSELVQGERMREGIWQDQCSGRETSKKAEESTVIEKKHLATAVAFPCSLYLAALPVSAQATGTAGTEFRLGRRALDQNAVHLLVSLSLQQPTWRLLLKEKANHLWFPWLFSIGTVFPCLDCYLFLGLQKKRRHRVKLQP